VGGLELHAVPVRGCQQQDDRAALRNGHSAQLGVGHRPEPQYAGAACPGA
jgi:hypothetical protein